MENPYCSCKLTHVRAGLQSQCEDIQLAQFNFDQGCALVEALQTREQQQLPAAAVLTGRGLLLRYNRVHTGTCGS